MSSLRNLYFVVLLVLCCVLFAPAQPPPAAGAVKNAEPFVSLEAGFSIDLPGQFRAYSHVKPVEGISTGGSSFTWQGKEAAFVIAYNDLVPGQDAEKIILLSAEGFANDYAGRGWKIVHNIPVTVNGISARDLRMTGATGEHFLLRYLATKGRIFTLKGVWPAATDGSAATKILDSFTFIDSRSVIEKRLADATPPPLPQVPAVKRTMSDAELDGLKGKVRSVVEKKESLSVTGASTGVRETGRGEYDRRGSVTKRIMFDYKGNPMYVRVYGFIDGKRVSLEGKFIKYEYNPPPPMAAPGITPKQPERPRDERYSVSYEDKYDEQNRLIEHFSYNNRAELISREVYTYEGNKVYRNTFNKEGKETWRALELRDNKNNLIDRTYLSGTNPRPRSYTYLSFDQKGNWTKRELKGETTRSNGATEAIHDIEYRVLTYY